MCDDLTDDFTKNYDGNKTFEPIEFAVYYNIDVFSELSDDEIKDISNMSTKEQVIDYMDNTLKEWLKNLENESNHSKTAMGVVNLHAKKRRPGKGDKGYRK